MPTTNQQLIVSALNEAKRGLEALLSDPIQIKRIEQAADVMISALKKDGKILSCGNGGSLCDAMHFAEELSGRYRLNRAPIAAMALADPSHMSCVGNDYGYDLVFSRFVGAIGKKGDVLLGISTSGTSKNIVLAAQAAKERGMKVVVLTGKVNTPLENIADVTVVTPAGRFADRVQELHIKVIHILIELIEKGVEKTRIAEE